MTPLIHVARIQPQGREIKYLYLRKVSDNEFRWFQDTSAGEEQTAIVGITAEDAIVHARRHWGNQDVSFRTVICGFRYTLPERDEHGCNALFHQMALSYSSMNGVYFDQDLGHNCIVHFASNEARLLWQKLKTEGRV